MWECMIDMGSHFADFVRRRPHTHALNNLCRPYRRQYKFTFVFTFPIFLIQQESLTNFIWLIMKCILAFKGNESMCVAKSELQCVITIIKIFDNKSKSRRLGGKIFHFYKPVLLWYFNYHCTFLQSKSYYTPLITLFQ